MYITNPEIIKSKFTCGLLVSNYLKDKGILYFYNKNGKYYFVETDLVREILDLAPLTIKIAMKFGI